MDVKTVLSGKTARWALIALAALVAVGAVWIGLGATGIAPSWMPTPFGATADETAGGSGADPALGGDPAPLKPASSGTTGAGDASDDGGDSGTETPGTETPGTDTPGTETPGDDTPAADAMTLRILWWNDTEKTAPTGFEVAVGTTTWSPADAKAKTGVGSLPGLAYDQKLTLVIYPDGPTGTRVSVPIMLTKDMVSNSDSDAVHVEVRDDTVRVLGTPVENFDVSFDRR